MVVDIIANENDAVEFVIVAAHLALDLATSIDQAPQNNRIYYVDTMGAPPFIEVIEQHPNGLLVIQIAGNQAPKLFEIVLVEQFSDLRSCEPLGIGWPVGDLITLD